MFPGTCNHDLPEFSNLQQLYHSYISKFIEFRLSPLPSFQMSLIKWCLVGLIRLYYCLRGIPNLFLSLQNWLLYLVRYFWKKSINQNGTIFYARDKKKHAYAHKLSKLKSNMNDYVTILLESRQHHNVWWILIQPYIMSATGKGWHAIQ